MATRDKEYYQERLKAIENHPDVTNVWCDETALDPNRQASIWYEEGACLEIEIRNRFIIEIRCCGEVDMNWTPKDGETDSCNTYDIYERIEWLKKHGITCDEDLSAEELDFQDSNWFACEIYDRLVDEYITDYDTTYGCDILDLDPDFAVSEIITQMQDECIWERNNAIDYGSLKKE